jgi:hypothetical protein
MPLAPLKQLKNARGEFDYSHVLVAGSAGGTDAIPLNANVVDITLAGATDNDFTLADGTPGQVVTVVCSVMGGAGEGVLTPDTFANGSTATFTAALQSIVLAWVPTLGWISVGTTTTTIA